jgi:DNA-binding LacI/PurR family transcriptional regulator
MKPNGYGSFSHNAYYYEEDALELFGSRGVELQGRVFRVRSNGNGYTSKGTVRRYAMWAAGKAAYDKGYKEFSILDEDSDVSTSFVTNQGYTNTVNKHSVTTYIVLITEDDYYQVDNIYQTEKYYQPGSKP